MANEPQSRFGFTRRAAHGKARPLSVSIYPKHECILKAREREFSVGRSILIGVLLEIDEREGLLRKELVRRLRPTNWTTNKKGA